MIKYHTDKTKVQEMVKKKKITCSDDLPENVKQQCKELGFKGKPVIAEKYVNKLRTPVGLRDHDIDAGNVAYKVGDKLIISPEIGKAYFDLNLEKVEQ